MIKLTVKEAQGLPNVDVIGKSDPYVKVSFRGDEQKTKVIDDNLNPVWNKDDDNEMQWDLAGHAVPLDATLHVKVKDWGMWPRRLLGQVTIELKDVLKRKDCIIERKYPLKDSSHRPTSATIELRIEYIPPSGLGVLEFEQVDGRECESDEDEDEDKSVNKDQGQETTRRKKRKRHRTPSNPRTWSCKVQDFQIQIKILEGRRLPGMNIHPLVRVTVGQKQRETQVKKSSNSPIYNQNFFFNFHTSEAELFDDLIILEVYNSRTIRSDALLGYFECDIGSVYQLTGHAFVRKWLLLTGTGTQESDDEDKEVGSKKSRVRGRDGAPAGYLKVTASVLGPGDEPPASSKYEPSDLDEDDIESNLLAPMGLTRLPAIFSLKVYLAEDLPQMDSGLARSIRRWFLPGTGKEDASEAKKSVDPFLVFSFCGEKVQTKTHYCENNPGFNTLLRLPVMFPSMCERIKLQLWDWDRGSKHDCIGTAYLSLSEISGQNYGSRFRPLYGPCYLNFYGSPREFSMISDEHEDLNKGIGEGAAYRGRVLIELSTDERDDIVPPVSTLHDEESIVIQHYLKQDQFKLFACFYQAAMVTKTGAPIEFEVSIGNFGNTLDETVAACNTPPTNPLYDGCYYHYLPWFSQKPCICLNCNWENIAFRIEPLNVLSRMCERLENNIQRAREEMKQLPIEYRRAFTMIQSVLQDFIKDCSSTVKRFKKEQHEPKLTVETGHFKDQQRVPEEKRSKEEQREPKLPGQRNKLDIEMSKLRERELNDLIKDANNENDKFNPKDSEMNIEKVITEMECFLERLKGLAFEPQNSMPDVIIWMLSGGKRIAYHRVPAKDVFYSPRPDACGKWCGKCVELLMKHPGKKAQDVKHHPEVPAVIRVELWLGLRDDQKHWALREDKEGKFVFFAEMYENAIRSFGGWTSPGIALRSQYSNASGDIELDKNKFLEPRNWHFEGDWKPSVDKRYPIYTSRMAAMLTRHNRLSTVSLELSTFRTRFDDQKQSVIYTRDWGLKTFVEEIYEHQRRKIIGGGWNNSSNWTDADDEPCESPAKFPQPEGWEWKSKWIVDTNRAVDADGWEYKDEISGVYVKAQKGYHLQRRQRWICTRALVNPKADRKRVKLEELAKEGWEYAPSFLHKFHVKSRKTDFVRRKRLLRKLAPDESHGLSLPELPPKLIMNLKTKKKVKEKKLKTQEKDRDEAAERLLSESEEEREGQLAIAPRMFVEYEKSRKFQLWVYIYQARDLLAMDDSGLSDPYVRVVFSNQSQATEVRTQTLCPTWDQMLIFQQVEIFDTVKNIHQYPPSVVLEVFDMDPVSKDDFIGRSLIKPRVQLKGVESRPLPALTWITVRKGDIHAGELLIECELFLDEGQELPHLPKPKNAKTASEDFIWPIRDTVRPQLQRVAVEILCWGVRNMKKYRYAEVNSPRVEFVWGNRIADVQSIPGDSTCTPAVFKSEVIDNIKKCPNFPNPTLERTIVVVPVEPYTPAMSIRVFDKRAFHTPLVGVHSIPSLRRFERLIKEEKSLPEEPLRSPSTPIPVQRTLIREDKKDVDRFDWWSKYYYSLMQQKRGITQEKRRNKDMKEEIVEKLLRQFSSDDGSSGDHLDKYDKKGYDTLTIFPKQLEKMGFEGLEDFVTSFPIKRGKSKEDEEDDGGIVGELKASFFVHLLEDNQTLDDIPRMFGNLQEAKRKWPIKCLVRVYIICGVDLQPQDPNGLADPYVVISIGNKTIDDRKNYKSKTLDPIFGKMFELHTSIPKAKDLKITVMDHDWGTRHDLIGETTIDLEQRLLSRYHASCGLPKTYYTSGPFAWRDNKRPKDILREHCRVNGLVNPVFYHKGDSVRTIVVGNDSWNIEDLNEYDEERSKEIGSPEQRLSLHALHKLGLVPEHVETRPLYSALQPHIQQGNIQLWVDIFAKDGGALQPPIDIEPRKPRDYVLRVVVWDTTDVVLLEKSLTGERMSDIFVKAWIDEINEKQETDVHYRSLDGDGNFNWRMEFPFLFMPVEKKILFSKQKIWYIDDSIKQKVPPRLKIQIWENDKFSPDDFIGCRTLTLHDLAKPCGSSRWCGTKNDPGVRQSKPEDFVDLFTTKRIRGWWGCWKDDEMHDASTGKVDMSIEILTAEEAKASPVGLGRSDPNQHPYLPEPNRPSTSFLWFMSPFKTMRYVVWRNYKWYIIGAIVIIFIALAIVLFVYNVPGLSARKLLGV